MRARETGPVSLGSCLDRGRLMVSRLVLPENVWSSVWEHTCWPSRCWRRRKGERIYYITCITLQWKQIVRASPEKGVGEEEREEEEREEEAGWGGERRKRCL